MVVLVLFSLGDYFSFFKKIKIQHAVLVSFTQLQMYN